MTAPLRWGILGTANIARKNWRAMRLTGNAVVTTVASREQGRAQRFIDGCQSEIPFEKPPRALGSYEDLVNSTEVDAVYIPLPTALRRDWVIRAARNGKHVICEKPCASSSTDLREMLAACRQNNVQFADGVMFSHSRRFERVLATLKNPGPIGELRRIASGFSFRAPDNWAASNIRADARLEPQGCAGDLGWYCIRVTLLALGGRMPRSVIGHLLSEIRPPGSDSSMSVPSEFSAELFFDGGISASFYCSFRTELEQWVSFSGDRGRLLIQDFVLPYAGDELSFEVTQPTYEVHGCDFRMVSRHQHIDTAEPGHGAEGAQEVNLFHNFSAAALSGQLNPAWPELAWKTQVILDACITSARKRGTAVTIPVAGAAP